MSTVKKIIHSKFMHIFIAINCNLLHKYGHRKRLHRLWNHVLLLLYAAVKVVGGVNELYMLSTCQKCNNKAYVWGTSHTQTNYIWFYMILNLSILHLCLAAAHLVKWSSHFYIPLRFYFEISSDKDLNVMKFKEFTLNYTHSKNPFLFDALSYPMFGCSCCCCSTNKIFKFASF